MALETATTAGVTVVESIAGSGAVKKLSAMIASNSSAVDVSVRATIVRGSTEITLVAPTIVDASSSAVLLTRDTPIYLEDGDLLKAYTITSGATMDIVCSYEEVV
jgi:hypothetical protein